MLKHVLGVKSSLVFDICWFRLLSYCSSCCCDVVAGVVVTKVDLPLKEEGSGSLAIALRVETLSILNRAKTKSILSKRSSRLVLQCDGVEYIRDYIS